MRARAALVVLLVAGRAEAEAPLTGELTLGLALRGDRPASGDVARHEDPARGLVIPRLSLGGASDRLTWAFAGRDLRERDQSLLGSVAARRLSVRAHLDRLPRYEGEGRSPYARVGDALRLPDAAQLALQAGLEAAAPALDAATLLALVEPLQREAAAVRPRLDTRAAGLAFEARPSDDLRVSLAYARRARKGSRRSGAAFGLWNAVEVAEPVDEVTHALSLDGEWTRGWGSLRALVRCDRFVQSLPFLAVDNPLRATDATAPLAHMGPGPATTAGAADALLALAPGNAAISGSAVAIVKLPAKTRVTAELGLSRLSQDEAFAPATTNDTLSVAGPAASSLGGRIDLARGGLAVSSTPHPRVTLRARARLAAMDNDTPRHAMPGVARLDAALEAIPRLSVPYARDDQRLQASVAGRLLGWTVELAHRRDRAWRAHRETDRTDERTTSAAVLRGLGDRGRLRLSYERSDRDFGVYDNRRSTEASRVLPRPNRTLGAARRYDQAIRDGHRARATVEWEATPAVVVAAGGWLDAWTFPGSAYGLYRAGGRAAELDVSVAPAGARWDAHATASWERRTSGQRTRYSPLPTISVDLRNVWSAALREDVLGAAASARLRTGGFEVRLAGDVQVAEGHGDFDSPPGGIPDIAVDIAELGDIRSGRLVLEAERPLGARLGVALGAWGEWWSIDDLVEEPGAGVVGGALLLAPSERDGRIGGVFARLTLRLGGPW